MGRFRLSIIKGEHETNAMYILVELREDATPVAKGASAVRRAKAIICRPPVHMFKPPAYLIAYLQKSLAEDLIPVHEDVLQDLGSITSCTTNTEHPSSGILRPLSIQQDLIERLISGV